jgi:PAS domain S-box-containing protein
MKNRSSPQQLPDRGLAEINRAITTSLNFDKVLDLIVENAAQLVGARICVLLLVDRNEILKVCAARGAPNGFSEKFSATMNEDAVRALNLALEVSPNENLIAVPVIATNAVNGLLAIVRARPMNPNEQWQLSSLADQAAIALQNARLFEIESAEAMRLRDASELSRRHLAAIVESSDDAIISKDLKGVIQSWNAGAQRIFGYSADEMIGQNITRLMPPDRLNEETTIIERICRGERVDHFETMRRRKDGSLINVSLTISPIKNDQGEVIGASKIARDITDRKRVEAALNDLLTREQAARSEAEEANRLKDEFLATLSHELRNPLNVVVGYAEILLRSRDNCRREFIYKAADTIRRNALAQSRLVSDLLDLSRMQIGKLSLDVQPVSLATVLTDAIDTVRSEASAKAISFNIEIENDAVVVEGDSTRLGQIAWNLLNNAVKFTPPTGQVTVTLQRSGDVAELRVTDNGQGIAPEFLPHVFEIFRQADGSSVRRQGGMGIGLALVKQLAELHGGSASVESKGLGQGATFSVKIPLHDTTAIVDMPHSSLDSGVLKGKSILVVDDSQETTDMLTNLLALEGARVESASNGAEALQVASEHDFDLIISDISMPEMDGYQLLQKIRSLPAAKQMPALALTGYGRSTDVARARAEGFSDHITKPLDIDRFMRTVRHLTEARH